MRTSPLIILLAACLLTTSCIRISSWGTQVNGVELKYKRTIDLAGPVEWERLRLDVDMGSIDLTGQDGADASLAITIHEKEPDDVRVTFGRSGIEVHSAGGHPYLVTSVTGSIPRVPMRLKTNMGSVTLSQMQGVERIDLESNMGAVRLRSARDVGSVEAKSNMGTVEVEEVTTSGGLTARSNMGAVRITDSSALKLDAHSNMGAVVVTRSTGKSLHARSNIGGVRLSASRFEASDVKTNLGGVSIVP